MGEGRGLLRLACSSSSLLLFSGTREIERQSGARVKWHVFRIIDFWLPALRVTSQVYIPSCVSVNGASAVISGSLW